MELTEDMAEVVGAILGDGCLSKYYSRSEHCWRHEVAFTGSNDDFRYYANFIQPAFRKFFGVKGRLFIRKGDNSTRFHVRSRRVFEFFVGIGLPVGTKPPTMEIPSNILREQRLGVACARGLWNTDGSIYRRFTKKYPSQKKHYGGYLVMQLKMNAKPLLLQVMGILKEEGIEPAPLLKEKKAFVLRIGKQEGIAKYLSTIGFSNPHHTDRIASFGLPAHI